MFTTCGSARKRKYLLDTFPGLRDDHIGNSRSTAFEHMIMHMVRSCTCVATPVNHTPGLP